MHEEDLTFLTRRGSLVRLQHRPLRNMVFCRITHEFLEMLEADGIAPKRSVLARLSVIVADLGDRSEGEGAALALLSRVVH